ncbi:2-hydroxyacid dehydrogenase [Thalassotalea mangrovi]|uniref:2-hydroxyacid dehydrogenase n=1 Tax=Thalassotalea mangrovi TaxID=2572245 RepID=A0A4U1B5G5_9GAMM|nr:2-hydroxyacid dehydrogenase [Thalassotalea mangrovi]TKB45348.1 2-hydroxyacid dehydrogenase [Thalassotalea mangrovi]
MFKVAVFSSKKYDEVFLSQSNQSGQLQLDFFASHLDQQTVELVQGYQAVCVFVNDVVDHHVLRQLHKFGVKVVALRCAGFNNLDLKTAHSLGIQVCRVPEYSPQAVAEHTIGLLLTLSRKYHKAYLRVRENNFSLDGLMGFNLYGKTAGIIGVGKIGSATIKILLGFGCKVLCYDPSPNPEAKQLDIKFVPLNELFANADIISLHCPLNHGTKHIINRSAIELMKPGVTIINTSRGGVIDSKAIIEGLKSQKIGFLGLDVYELESELFFEDLSDAIIQDDVFTRLLTFPNVFITGHQGFFTEEALITIGQTTIENLEQLLNGKPCENVIESAR